MKPVRSLLAALALACLAAGARGAADGAPRSLISGDFQLQEAAGGRSVDRHSYDGRFRLVFFGFTRCGLVCPLSMKKLGAVLQGLGRDAGSVVPLFITLDPERDTPAVLKDYAAAFDPRIVPLWGVQKKVDAAMRGFRLEAERLDDGAGGYQFEHPAVLYLMDRQGAFVELFSTNTPADALVGRIRAAMKKG
jgi:protein SCO1/2